MWKLLLITLATLFLVKTATAADSVTTNKACYLSTDSYTATFADNSPQSGLPRSGTVTFPQRVAAGTYQVVLRRKNNGAILATSASFRVVASGQSCTATTPPPTRAPTLKPVVAATLPPTPVSVNDLANQALNNARAAIAALVQANNRLTPEFIRMGFHDCIHVCDGEYDVVEGCIDLTDANNNGLAHPISVLEPIVAQFANPSINVSRADIWALAAMVGADVANHGTITQPISFAMKWFGRINCEDANTVCTNAQGVPQPCSPTVGPARKMPSVHFDGPSLFSYFSTEFSLTQQQVVALMGAHTVGHLVKAESGINGPNGWNVQNTVLHNEYYNALMGGATANTPINQMVGQSPGWVRTLEDNTGTGSPNITRWALTAANLPIVMLHPDVSLVRDLNPTNTNPVTGAVSCAFNANAEAPTPACNPSSNILLCAQFSDNNDLWLSQFNIAMDLMLTNGYNRNACAKAVCPLTLK